MELWNKAFTEGSLISSLKTKNGISGVGEVLQAIQFSIPPLLIPVAIQAH